MMTTEQPEDFAGATIFEAPTVKISRCLICGSILERLYDSDGNRIRVKEEAEINFYLEKELPVPNSILECTPQWEINLFERFLKAVKLRKGKNNPKINWSLDSEPVPLCNDCQCHLTPLQQLVEKMEEMEKLISDAVEELKQRMNGFEENFQQDKVYKEDQRYYWVRAHVIGKDRVGQAPNHEQQHKTQSRGPGRPRKKVPSAGASNWPMIVIRKSDQDAADLHSKNLRLKEEAMETQCFADDPAPSWSPPASPVPAPAEDSNSFVEPEPTVLPTKKLKRGRPPKNKESAGKSRRLKRNVRKKLNRKERILPEEFDPASPSPGKEQNESRDDDFVPPPSASSSSESESEDEDDEEYEAKEKGKPGRPKKIRVKINKETGIVTCLRMEFQQLDDTTFKCAECGKVVFSTFQVESHVVKFHTNKFRCKLCDYRGSSAGCFRNHVRHVHEGKQRKCTECDICGKRIRKSLLKYHRVTHYSAEERKEAEEGGELDFLKSTNNGDYVCQHCGRAFNRPHNLVKHEEIAHSSNTQSNEGDDDNDNSGEWTPVQSTSQKKKKKQEGETKAKEALKCQCQICGKMFRTAKSLRTHTGRQHPNTDEASTLPFACTFCNLRFLTQRDLCYHKSAIHTGDRPFHCNYQNCMRKFVTNQHLKNHMKVHSSIKRFPCPAPDCEMTFLQNHHVKRHFAIYHGPDSNPKRKSFVRGPSQAPFQVFKKWKNVYLGETQETEVRRRKCPYPNCPAAFQYPSQVKRHILTFHTETPQTDQIQDLPSTVTFPNNEQKLSFRTEENVSHGEGEWSQQSTTTQDAVSGSRDHQEIGHVISPVPENLTMRTNYFDRF